MKTIGVVQARMSSRRFPGKMLTPLAGAPLILRVCQRLSRSQGLDEVVVATSSEPEDEPLARCAEEAGFKCVRGPLDDVLARFLLAAGDADVVVRVSGDCPLIAPELVDAMLKRFHSSELDYLSNVSPPSFPDGLDVEVVRRAALEQADRDAVNEHQREHVTPYVREHPELFRQGNYRHEGGDLSQLHWSVDYPEDLALVEELLAATGPDPELTRLLAIIEERPDLAARSRKEIPNEGAVRTFELALRREAPLPSQPSQEALRPVAVAPEDELRLVRRFNELAEQHGLSECAAWDRGPRFSDWGRWSAAELDALFSQELATRGVVQEANGTRAAEGVESIGAACREALRVLRFAIDNHAVARLTRPWTTRARVVLGAAALGLPYGDSKEPPTRETVGSVLGAAAELGVTTVDTAPAYGRSEQLMGELWPADGDVWTKLGHDLGGGPGLRSRGLASLDASLDRLSRDHVALYQWHNWQAGLAQDPEFLALWEALVDDPRVERVGVSVYERLDAEAAIRSGRFQVVQLPWSLLDQGTVTALGELARREGVELAFRSVYLQGILAGRAPPAAAAELEPVVAQAQALADQVGATLPELALRAALQHPAASWVLIGIDRPDQWEPVQRALNAGPLPVRIRAELSSLDRSGSAAVDPRQW